MTSHRIARVAFGLVVFVFMVGAALLLLWGEPLSAQSIQVCRVDGYRCANDGPCRPGIQINMGKGPNPWIAQDNCHTNAKGECNGEGECFFCTGESANERFCVPEAKRECWLKKQKQWNVKCGDQFLFECEKGAGAGAGGDAGCCPAEPGKGVKTMKQCEVRPCQEG